MGFLGDFIAGEFKWASDPTGEWQAVSPADLSDSFGRVIYSFSAIDGAVGAARAAAGSWSRAPQSERSQCLLQWSREISSREPALVDAIAREIGKPVWEAELEVRSLAAKIETLLQEGTAGIGGRELPNLLEGTRGTYHYRPLGVFAIITPFSFPAASLVGQAAAALLTGNTIVVKPSEKAPRTAQLLAEAALAARFPAGVFNLIQGGPEAGRRLSLHEGIDGVLFTGSYETGNRIQQDTLHQNGKAVHLQMGGKNPILIWEDAAFESALEATLVSAYLTAGQRCTSASRVILHASLADRFVSELHARTKKIKIGHPSASPFMGPLIEAGAVDRYLKFQGIASRESSEIIMRGKAIEPGRTGYYVSPSIVWIRDTAIESARKSVFQQTEILAPSLAVLAVSELEHALALMNASPYGLVASIYSQSRGIFARCQDQLQYGMLNWNRPTTGGSSRLPFCGMKKSGNRTPGGVLTALATVRPVATLESEQPVAPDPAAYPGLMGD